MSVTVMPFALGAAIVALFFRISGLIYERTINVGEVIIFQDEEVQEMSMHPGTTTYNIGEIVG